MLKSTMNDAKFQTGRDVFHHSYLFMNEASDIIIGDPNERNDIPRFI